MTAMPAAAEAERPSRRSVGGWVAARGLRVLSWILVRLPETGLHRLAHSLGGILYLLQPARRRLVHANLERVVTYLAANGLGGEAASEAAGQPAALDRLTRAAFGHYVRGYLEGAILPIYAREENLERVQPDDPAQLELAFTGTGVAPEPMIIVGMHFGAIEIPALWATRRFGRRITAPMETVNDPELQAYFERTRGQTGLRLIPIEDAAPALRRSLTQKETVALVADRPLTSSGASVELFGAPARLPLGPAALAYESGAPCWLIATRRVGTRDYRARIERIEMPSDGSRRDRLSGFLTAQARAFERAIADAPEQWWTVFFPIWDDIRA
jgi:KDO2-lipid IV(A) lauroyltransferase